MRGELEQQPAVDGAEGQLAALGALARAWHVVEQPGEFGRRKIRIEQQAGARGDLVFEPGGAQRLAGSGGAPVLPDDGGRDGRRRSRDPKARWFRAGCVMPDRGDVARA